MNGKPLSILHVLAPAEVGGLETVVRALATGHAAQGHTVEIAAVLDTPTNRFVEAARDEGLQVHVINSPPRSFLPERHGVRELLDSGRFQVMHSHGYRSDILDIGVARRAGVPSVTTLHGFSATDNKARVYEWLQLRGATRASAVVAVSTNVASRLIASGARPQSVHLIRNAAARRSAPALSTVAARRQLSLPDGAHIGWVGRLSSEKGPDVMLEAMAHLRDLPVTLSFVGDGPDRASLTERANSLGILDQVRFHGNVPDAAGVLSAFDVLALSSRTEGTPMIILEAMAAELPIVAARVGGVPDIISTEDAVLVDPQDPGALALAIRAVLADRHSAAARAKHAKERLTKEFSNDEWLARYERLYRSIQRNDESASE